MERTINDREICSYLTLEVNNEDSWMIWSTHEELCHKCLGFYKMESNHRLNDKIKHKHSK